MEYRLDILALLTILLTTGVVLTVPVHEGKINGNWSEWIDISICYAKSCNISCGVAQEACDKGHVEQIRFCNSPSPRNGGQWCHGPALRTADCINYMRPGWSEWGPVTCNSGCRSSENDIVAGSRIRTCTNPPPIYEKDTCCGNDIQFADLDPELCKHLPLCSDTTVSTTTTLSTTKITLILMIPSTVKTIEDARSRRRNVFCGKSFCTYGIIMITTTEKEEIEDRTRYTMELDNFKPSLYGKYVTCPPTTTGFIYDNPEEKDNSVKAVHDGYYDYDNEC